MFLEKVLILAQKTWFYQNATTKQIESFIKSNFDENQVYQIVLTQNL